MLIISDVLFGLGISLLVRNHSQSIARLGDELISHGSEGRVLITPYPVFTICASNHELNTKFDVCKQMVGIHFEWADESNKLKRVSEVLITNADVQEMQVTTAERAVGNAVQIDHSTLMYKNVLFQQDRNLTLCVLGEEYDQNKPQDCVQIVTIHFNDSAGVSSSTLPVVDVSATSNVMMFVKHH